MAKSSKLKSPKGKLNGTMEGKIGKKLKKQKKRDGKPTKHKNMVKNKKVKSKKLSAKKQKQHLNEDEDSSVIKRKPSKVELKSVIEALKKDATLVVVRKALKYTPYYLKSEGLTKKLLKEIIRLWAEAGEKVRVICLLCLIRIYTKIEDQERKQLVIKKLYNSFLDKCRITKHETMSMIGFMRHSLIELYKLDQQIAFKQAQTSYQQLTLTLKNALTHKNEETSKSVLNWQFVNCLILLSQMIMSYDDNSPVKSLTHQVIQLNLGAVTFLTSPRYYPYYCHLIENLIGLCEATNLFIPVLPLMLGILDRIELSTNKDNSKRNATAKENSKAKENSRVKFNQDNGDHKDRKETKIKNYNMELLNHVSIEETRSSEYIVAVLDKIHELMVRYLASQCNRISFPELVLLPTVQLKKWLKKNPGQPALKFKILLDKIKSDCEKLTEARQSVTFAFTDYTAVDAWEKGMRDSKKLSLARLASK